ncbi:hypothetical protein [Neisseria meningitidis]|uniref:hypothetical protein n=1 Tax=Neisseria meningitidis TaxID=487 RepID=UPI001EDFC58F|nr:hypothetical protein [Neisseria meningitidis]MCG3356362.1 hypothetical protein [Neisseria meningitidis]
MESKETVLFGKFPCRWVWIPAFAGMTVGGVSVFSDRFLWFFGCWIPAFAGMTAVGVSVFSDKFLLRCVFGFQLLRE